MPVRDPAKECSRALLETVPPLMHVIREEMRRHNPPWLSIPQLRTLAHLHRTPGACLFEVAEHLGVSRPTASALVERLVRRGLLTRTPDPMERRRVVLNLTSRGVRHYERARASAQARLAASLDPLSPEMLDRIRDALTLLGRLLQTRADGVERRAPASPRPGRRRPAAPPAPLPDAARPGGTPAAVSPPRSRPRTTLAAADARSVLSRKLLGLVAVLVVAVGALSACTREPGQAQAKGPVVREAIPVVIDTAVSKAVPLQVKAIGTVQAFASVTVKSQVDGEIARAHIADGQEVHKGDILFTLDQRPFEAALRQAEANLARDTAQLQQVEGTLAQTMAAEKQALANLARDRAQLDNATAQLNRYRGLLDEGAISRELHDQVRTNAAALEATLQADQAAVENARASIRAAQATVESVRSVLKADQAVIENLRVQLGYTTIRAPMDGRAGNLLVRVGSAVKARDDTSQLVVLNQFHPIYVSFAVPEQTLAEIRTYWAAGGLRVDALVPDQPRAVQGQLSFINNAVDATSGTIQLKATFANQERILWPGQFVNVVMTLTVQPDRVVVPSRAILSGQQGQYVFVVRPDLTVESRPVVVARTGDLESVVAEGVRAGEQLVTDGQLRLAPGARVQPKTPGPAGANGGPAR